jgi:hypothetical protein
MRAGRFAVKWGGGESAIEGAIHGIEISLVVPLHDRMQMSLSRTQKKNGRLYLLKSRCFVMIVNARFRKTILH